MSLPFLRRFCDCAVSSATRHRSRSEGASGPPLVSPAQTPWSARYTDVLSERLSPADSPAAPCRPDGGLERSNPAGAGMEKMAWENSLTNRTQSKAEGTPFKRHSVSSQGPNAQDGDPQRSDAFRPLFSSLTANILDIC